jgi:hypothetical protein
MNASLHEHSQDRLRVAAVRLPADNKIAEGGREVLERKEEEREGQVAERPYIGIWSYPMLVLSAFR